MVFASSSSAFGIKPFASSQTLVPTQPNTPPSGPQSTTQSSFASLGQQNQQPAQSGGLFGQSSSNAQQTTGQSGGLFGQSGANTQQQPGQSGGLFGGVSGTAQQNQPSGGLFGSGGQIQSQTQQPSTGFLGQPPSNAALASSNFFATPPAGQTSTQTGGGLFGSSTNQPLGTSWNQNNPLLPKSAFGGGGGGGPTTGTINTGTSSFLGQPPQQGTGLGALSSQQQQQQQPSLGTSALQPAQTFQPAGPPLFTKSTKFNDLPENLKKTFEEIESHIQGRVQIVSDLKQRKVGDEAMKGQDLIRGVHKDLIASITTLQSDVLSTRDLKSKVDQTVQDTIVATKIIDGFRNPQQQGAHLKNHATFPLEFFTRITEQMRRRLQWYKATIEQIERKLASAAQRAQYTPQGLSDAFNAVPAISTTLEAQHASFIALANKTAALDADLQKLKAVYTQLWRAKTGSMRDPFNELDRGSGGEFGLENL
ncbi:hypothetical protein EW146_g4935 [Bondarzewia mesenterica]|uniref:Nucleoporin Nup54 alpha-helical domain-containing protein n=1 Tax=Bondarzewia mesenterica TaxID=1095465 RepID=A0A4V3XEZ9_9AGAM|nr:hypothetical protein EW146_g4935 [Bondarzewia mesenterica]